MSYSNEFLKLLKILPKGTLLSGNRTQKQFSPKIFFLLSKVQKERKFLPARDRECGTASASRVHTVLTKYMQFIAVSLSTKR